MCIAIESVFGTTMLYVFYMWNAFNERRNPLSQNNKGV